MKELVFHSDQDHSLENIIFWFLLWLPSEWLLLSQFHHVLVLFRRNFLLRFYLELALVLQFRPGLILSLKDFLSLRALVQIASLQRSSWRPGP